MKNVPAVDLNEDLNEKRTAMDLNEERTAMDLNEERTCSGPE